MATYGIYSKDLKGCYISGLSKADARRYMQGEDRVLCLEREVTDGFEVTLHFRKKWYWRLRPKFRYLDMGFMSVCWYKTRSTEPYKVISD